MPLVRAFQTLFGGKKNHERDAEPPPQACHALLRQALDKCVVTEDADCARVLQLYHQHRCNNHSLSATSTTPMDFMDPGP